MTEIPRNHPRYISLITREKISEGIRNGLVHETGLIAHGRGEAFDYLIGEKTQFFGENAAKTSAAFLLLARDPVISVNGNVVALCAKECISLAESVHAKIEVNLFHRTNERIRRLVDELKKSGAKQVYGSKGDARITGLEHNRGFCDSDGIFLSDTILVPLEDGDRCQALKKMGKKVITIDLNPLSRTARAADVTVVDNLIRAVPNIEKWVKKLRKSSREDLLKIVDVWNNEEELNQVLLFICKRFECL